MDPFTLSAMFRVALLTLACVAVLVFFERRSRLVSQFWSAGVREKQATLFRAMFFLSMPLLNLPGSLLPADLSAPARMPLPWGFAQFLVIREHEVLVALYGLFVVSSVLAGLNVCFKVSAGVTTTLFFVLGLERLALGGAIHPHHFFWFSLFLWLTSGATAIRMCQAYLALVYFFPGVTKLAYGGLAWFYPESLATYIWAKKLNHSELPILIDVSQVPFLLSLGAIATVVFEVGFVFGLLHSRTRNLALAAALVFHVVVALTMGIQFLSIALLLPFLMEFRRSDAVQSPSAAPKWFLAALLGFILAGVTKRMEAWPIACYPPFERALSGRFYRLQAKYSGGTTHMLTPYAVHLSRGLDPDYRTTLYEPGDQRAGRRALQLVPPERRNNLEKIELITYQLVNGDRGIQEIRREPLDLGARNKP